MDAEPLVEVLGQEPAEALTDRAWAWLRAHPVVLFLLVVATLAVAVPLVRLATRGPEVPRFSVTDNGVGPAGAPWQIGADGRPTGPVVLSVTAIVGRLPGKDSLPGKDKGRTKASVLGLAGPGVIRADNPSVPVPAGQPAVPVTLRAVLDCTTLPATVPDDAYGLSVRVRSGTRLRTAIVPAGASGRRWRSMIGLACASWSARHDLTASALTAVVHPTASRFDVVLTLANAGTNAMTVNTSTASPGLRIVGRLPIQIPARASTRAAFTVVLDRCDSSAEPVNQTAPLSQNPVLTSSVNLVALASVVPLTPADSDQVPEGGGLGATGVVLAPDAARTLTSAFNRACGQILPPFPQLSARVRYDPGTREVSIPAVMYTEPGRVTSLRLRTEPAASDTDNAYVPLWTAFDHLVPDRSGRTKVTLRYRTPATGACPNFGGYLPDFLATVVVPVPGGTRTLNYEQTLDLNEDPHAIPLLCGGTSGADGQARSSETRSGPVVVPDASPVP